MRHDSVIFDEVSYQTFCWGRHSLELISQFTKTLSCSENYFWNSCCISVTKHIICLLSLYEISPSAFWQWTTVTSEVTVPVAVFGVTECVVIEYNNSLLLVSITLHVLVLLMDHHQVYKYMSKQQVLWKSNITIICELTNVTILFSVFVACRMFICYTKLKTTL
jgi:hypothetical protein